MMFSRLLISFLISVNLCFGVYASEYIESFEEKNISVLNDELRDFDNDIRNIEKNIIFSGMILMWSGAISDIPTGWVICDGDNDTPDLTDRFILHADADTGGTNDVGDTGTGSATHTHSAGSYSGAGHTHPQNTRGTTSGESVGAAIVSLNTNNSVMGVIGEGDDTPELLNSGVSSGGSGAITGTSGDGTVNHKPKYYALAYIMKT